VVSTIIAIPITKCRPIAVPTCSLSGPQWDRDRGRSYRVYPRGLQWVGDKFIHVTFWPQKNTGDQTKTNRIGVSYKRVRTSYSSWSKSSIFCDRTRRCCSCSGITFLFIIPYECVFYTFSYWFRVHYYIIRILLYNR
jgi:hypothetical protein